MLGLGWKRWDRGARIQDVISKPEVKRQDVQASRKAGYLCGVLVISDDDGGVGGWRRKLTAPQWQLPLRDGGRGVEETCCLLFWLRSIMMESVASDDFRSRRCRVGFVPWPFLSQMLAPPSLVSSIHIWTRSRRPSVLFSIPLANSHSLGSMFPTYAPHLGQE